MPQYPDNTSSYSIPGRTGEYNIKSQPAPTTGNAVETKETVVSPEHYQLFPDTEVIAIIESSLTKEEFKGYCKGNILKYRLRDKYDRDKDWEKSGQYLQYLKGI